ncbi:MAG TPA: hypothetical protein VFD75_04930, partial [Pyrinomonadaceae bacterium]|nr:hypothetical protein [Pyrinomonadaceae bacterium]
SKHATTNYGIQYTAKGLGSILAGPGAAWLMSTQGSWIPVFWCAVACNVTAAALALVWLKPRVMRMVMEQSEITSRSLTPEIQADPDSRERTDVAPIR